MVRAAALIALAAQSAAPVQESLFLRCEMTANLLQPSTAGSATARDDRGRSVTVTGVEQAASPRIIAVSFEMAGGAARIQFPSDAIPAFSDAKDGWLAVKGLTVAEDRISGSVRMNFLKTTTFEIDRVTGIMRFRGGFEGRCAPYDRARRQF